MLSDFPYTSLTFALQQAATPAEKAGAAKVVFLIDVENSVRRCGVISQVEVRVTVPSSDALLKSALEKIVYFEARVDQLSNDAGGVKAALERTRGDLAQASQREIELRRVVAELEVRLGRAHAEREDLARVVDALKRERAELIQKMLDASRIHRTGTEQEPADFDLAQFISTLRQEVVRPSAGFQAAPVATLSEQRAPAEQRQKPDTTDQKPEADTSSAVEALAQQLQSDGRLAVSAADFQALSGAALFTGHADETLFGFSVRELSALDAPSRIRAAERLAALAQTAAAPALAAALHVEHVPEVQIALLGALSGLAKVEAVPVVQPHLTSIHADVRIAALKALLALDAIQAGPHIAQAMKDPNRSVRRRASMLALSLRGAAAFELGELALQDAEPDVRALAVLVLGASGAEAARAHLLKALKDGDERVRRAASQAWSRHVGADVTSVVNLDEAQRRREVRKIAVLPVAPVSIQKVPAAPPAIAKPVPKQSADTTEVRKKIVAELRASIRGKQVDDLAQQLGLTSVQVHEVVQQLVSSGAAVRRGQKIFVG
jgi:HEAT repeat protein